jgi:hypothetical protein
VRTSEGWFQLTGYEVFHHTTRRDRQNWDQMDPVSRRSWEMRASGELAFIPSPNHHNHEEASTVVLPMPAPDDPMRYVLLDSPEFYALPQAITQMLARLEKHDWAWLITVCTGPWPKKTETVELENGSEEKTTYGQAPSVVLRFSRNGVVGYAMWLGKPWTKDGDKLKFHSAQVRPKVGLVSSRELVAIITRPDERGNNE